MSNEIDERVVQLQFDNKQFEKGVKESMDSLRRFNESLNSMESTSKMSQIADTVSTLTDRFSMMGTIGGRVLEQLTDRAVAFGSRMLRSLNQTREGWSRYESEMNATRTTMNATGKSMEEVERVFERLAKYSDETSYSLSDMQSNFSILTSTGAIRDLERAEQVMEGIANAAAFAGIGIRQAAWPMQTFTRAMSEGYMTRIRWNSLQSAKIINPELMQQFIEAGIRQGTLTKEGKVKGKNIKITESNFESSLQYKWLTADVMSDAFSVYADSTDGIGKIAYAAAMEARTFTDVLDTLRDVISTGWGTSFKLIFGNVEEASKLFTHFAVEVADVASNIAKFRNTLLKGWKEGGGRDSLVKSIEAVWQTLKKLGSLITTSLKNVFGEPTVDMLLNFSKKIETATMGIYKWLGGNNTSAGDKIVPRFVSIRHAIEGVLNVVNSLKTAAWEVVKFVGRIFGANFDTFDEFLLVIGRAGRFVTNLINAVHKAEIVPRFFTWLYNTIKPLAPILAFMMASWVMKGGLAAFFGANSGILGTIFKIIAGGLKLISVVGIAISTVTLAVAAFKFVVGIVQSIGPAFEVVKGKVVSVWNFLKALVSGIGAKIGNAFSNGFSGITSKIVGAFERVKEIVVKWLDGLKTGLPSVFEDVGNKLVSWYNIIKQRIKTILDGLPSVFDSVKSTIVGWATTIKNVLPGVWSSITDFFGNLWTNVTNWINTEVPTAWESMKNAISGFGTSIVAGVAEAFPKAWQAVQSFGERIFNGIFGEEGDKSKSGSKSSEMDVASFSSSRKYKGRQIGGHRASASVSDSDRALPAGTKRPLMERLIRFVTKTFSRIKTQFDAVWSSIKAWIVEKVAIVSNWFTSGEAATFVMSIIHSVQSFFTNAASSILDALAPAITWVSNTWNRIKDAVSGVMTNNIIPIFNQVKSWVSDKAKTAFDAVVTWVKNTWASLKEKFSGTSGTINFTFFINTMLALLPVLILLKRVTNLVKAFENIRTERLFALSFTMIGIVGGMTAITFVLINNVPGMLNSLGTALSAISDFVQRYHMAILIGTAVFALSLLSIGLMRIGRALLSARRNMTNSFSMFDLSKNSQDNSLVEVLKTVGAFMLKIAAPIAVIAASIGLFATIIHFVGPQAFDQAAKALEMIAAFIAIVLVAIGLLSLIFSRNLQVGTNAQGAGIFQPAGKTIASALKEVASLFLSLSALIAVIAGSMWALTLMTPEQFENARDRFSAMLGVATLILVTGLIAYSWFSKAGKVDVKGFASLAAGVALMVAVIAGVYYLITDQTNKAKYGDKAGFDWGALIGIVLLISGLVVALGFAMGQASKAGNYKKAFSAFLGMAIIVKVTIDAVINMTNSIKGGGWWAALGSVVLTVGAILGVMFGLSLILNQFTVANNDPSKIAKAASTVLRGLIFTIISVYAIIDGTRGISLLEAGTVVAIIAGICLCLMQLKGLLKTAGDVTPNANKKTFALIGELFGGLAGLIAVVAWASNYAKDANPFVVAAMLGGMFLCLLTLPKIIENASNVEFKSLAGLSLIFVGLGACFIEVGTAALIAKDVKVLNIAALLVGMVPVILAAARVVKNSKDVSFGSLSGVALVFAGLGVCFLAVGAAVSWSRDTNIVKILTLTLGMSVIALAAARVVKNAKDVSFGSLAGVALVFVGLGICGIAVAAAATIMDNIKFESFLMAISGMGVSLLYLWVAMKILESFNNIGEGASKGAWALVKTFAIVGIGVSAVMVVVALLAAVIAHLGYEAMTTFGSALEQLGGHLKRFQEKTKDLKQSDFTNVSECVRIVYEMVSNYIIPVNLQTWKIYNARLYDFGIKLKNFYDKVVAMDRLTLQSKLNIVNDIKYAVETLNGLPMTNATDAINSLGGAIGLYYQNLNKVSFKDADGNEIDPESINFEGIKEMFRQIATAMPDTNDIDAVGQFADDSEGTRLGRFAVGIINLSTALDVYVKSLGQFTTENLGTSDRILGALKGLNEALPDNSTVEHELGPIKTKVVKTNDSLQVFAGDIQTLGVSLGELASSVGGAIEVVDEETGKTNFDVAIEVAQKIAEVQKALPASGILTWFLGQQELGRFATDIPTLGEGIAGFVTAIKTANLEQGDVTKAGLVADIVSTLAHADAELSKGNEFLGNLFGVSSWQTFITNLEGLAGGIIAFVNKVNENKDVEYATSFVTGALSVLSALADPVYKMLSVGLGSISDAASQIPYIAAELVSMIRALSGADGQLTSEQIETAKSTLLALGQLFGSTLMDAFANGMALELANGEASVKWDVLTTAAHGITEYVAAAMAEGFSPTVMEDAKTILSAAGFDWGLTLITGIANGMTDIKAVSSDLLYDAAFTVATTLVKDFNDKKIKDKAEEIGKNLDLGLARGVSDEKNKAKPVGAFGQVILAMLARARNIADIHSPSGVAAAYGAYMDAGLAMGINNNAGGVFGSIDNLFGGIFSGVSEWFNGLVTSVTDWFGGLVDGLNLGDIGDGVISALNGDWSKVGELVGLDLGDGLLSGIDKAIFGEGGIEGAIFGEGGVMGAIKNYDFKGLLGEETGGRVNDIVGQILPTIENIDFSDPSSAAAALGQINWTSIFGEDSGIAQALGKVDWSSVVTDNLGGTLVNLLGGLDWTTLLGLDFMSEADLASYDNWNDVDWGAGLGAVNSGRASQRDEDKDNSSNLGGSGGSGRSSDSSTFGKQTTTVSAGGLVLSATEGYTIGDILNRIDRLENAITHMQIVMDSGVLAGQLAPAMDGALGTQAILGGRWN